MSADDLPHQVDSDQPNEATPLSCFDAEAEAAVAGPGAPPGRGITFTGIVTAVRKVVSNALNTALHTVLDRSPRRLPSLPHRCTRQSSTPSLASPSSQSKHASEPRPASPQVQRSSSNLIWTCPSHASAHHDAPPPSPQSNVAPALRRAPCRAATALRRACPTVARGIRRRPAASTPSSRCVIAADRAANDCR